MANPKEDRLRKVLASALVACAGIQSALDKSDLPDAVEWLDALSHDATIALNDVWDMETE